MASQPLRCPYCGQVSELIWIHCHGQCSVCGTNVDECCRGEGASAEADFVG